MIKYKIVEVPTSEHILGGFKVMVKKNWWSRWKYVRRKGTDIHAWWSTRRSAQAYINFLPKNKK